MNALTLSFRKAIPADADELNVMINAVYRGASAKKGWTFESDLVGGVRTTPEEIVEIIQTPGNCFVLAYSDSTLVGCIQYIDEGECAYIGYLAVKTQYQSLRVGTKLIQETERMARSEKKKFLRGEVLNPREELIASYARMGLVLTGESIPFPEKYPAKVPNLRLLEIKKTL
jgi:GNAT superfamily N-acetyltransferase